MELDDAVARPFIAIAGMIGAGKTTLARDLGAAMGLPVYYEPVEGNVYLEDFYRAMEQHAFAMQVFLLNQRIQQLNRIHMDGQGGVQDRTIFEDLVFARTLHAFGFMTARDHATYTDLFKTASPLVHRPDLIIFLDAPPEVCMRRIRERVRGCEVGVTNEYLTALHREYTEFMEQLARVLPVLRIDWSEFRPVCDVAEMVRARIATR